MARIFLAPNESEHPPQGNPLMTQSATPLVLYMRSLRHLPSCVFSSSRRPASKVFFDVRHSSLRQHSGPTLALTYRAAQCIKRGFWICNQRVACSPFRSAPASPPMGRNRSNSESPFRHQTFSRLCRDSRLEVRASSLRPSASLASCAPIDARASSNASMLAPITGSSRVD